MFVDYRIVAMMIKRYPLKKLGAGLGIGTSHPVVRQENGKYYLASFVYTLKADGVAADHTPGPTHWETVDPVSADLVNFYDCSVTPFAESIAASYPVSEATLTLNGLDFMTLYDKLDVVRHALESGRLDQKAYGEYFSSLLKLVPAELHPLYRALSNV